jgi:hypothetical protein
MNDSTSPSANPALTALGDQLQTAAATAVATPSGASGGRSRSKFVLIPAVALSLVVVLVLVMVGSGGSGGTAEASVASAARRTSERATGRFEATVEATGVVGASGTTSITTSGAYDADNRLFSASLDTSALAGLLPGGRAFPGTDSTIDVVVAGDHVYLDAGPFESVLGASWLEVTVPDVTSQQRLPSLIDPSAVLDTLQGAGADMRDVGREDVRGVTTTHYAGTISLQEAYGSLPADDRAAIERNLGAMVDDLPSAELPTDVWIDDDGIVRRVELHIDASAVGAPAFASDGAITLTVELFDIGDEIAIDVPDSSDVKSVDELVPAAWRERVDALLDDLAD